MLLVEDHIRDSDYHAAYSVIEKHYTQRASTNCDIFAHAAKAIILHPGQDFQAHWILLQTAWKNWAMVLGLQREGRVFVPTAARPRQTINLPEATANAQYFSDAELIDLNFRILIPEADRITMLVESIVSREDRFKFQIDRFYEQSTQDQTLRGLVISIETRENSKPGQIARELENRLSNKLKKDESSNSKTALLSTEETVQKFPIGSCVNHPTSTTHTTIMCRGQGIKSVNANEITKSLTKRTFENRNCSKCEKFNPNRKAFGTHNTESCTFNLPENPKVYKANVAEESSQPKPKKDKKKSTSSNENQNQIDEDRIYAMIASSMGRYIDNSTKKSPDGKKKE
jgi:hypothetical protein